MKKFVLVVLVVAAALAVAVAVRSGTRIDPRLGRPPGQHGAIAGKAVYYCPMHPTYTADKQGNCPICSMKLMKREPGEKRILYWTDPMIPGYRAEGPGKSPMGMDLVPVYEEPTGAAAPSAAPAGYAPIQLTPGKQQLIGVTTAVAQRRVMTRTIRAAGRIAYDPELYQAQQEYVQAVRTLARVRADASPDIGERSQQLVDAIRLRLRLLGLSPELIEEVGGQDGPDQSLLLADPQGRVWLYATVYEFELPLVTPGQMVVVEAPAAPGKSFEGVVRAVDPVLDPVTRTARVRAALTDPEGALKPEMYVNASLVVPIGDVLAVPDAAVLQTGTRQILFVDQGEGRFDPRRVTVGVTAEGFSEIRDGVAEGERVVTSGNFLIDSESRLKAAVAGMGEEGHRHGQ
ncbi:MAG: efflux RND transporter periplasmic adaptor subunit [Candidatus Omnitrophica bacterium]|nr:efflux RND transporter periplasmic adaptor subunit [Candidatus Omnitrophota bacterium]